MEHALHNIRITKNNFTIKNNKQIISSREQRHVSTHGTPRLLTNRSDHDRCNCSPSRSQGQRTPTRDQLVALCLTAQKHNINLTSYPTQVTDIQLNPIANPSVVCNVCMPYWMGLNFSAILLWCFVPWSSFAFSAKFYGDCPRGTASLGALNRTGVAK